MIKNLFVALVIFAVVVLVALAWQFIADLKPAEQTDGNLAELVVGEHAFLVESADTPILRSKGLSGRENLAENRGMLFTFDMPGVYSFWMKGMKFPLDIIWIKGERIIGFSENISPDNSRPSIIYNPPDVVDKVLEINAGLVEKFGIKVGDRID